MNKEDIALIDAALDGNVSKEEFATLQTLLREDPIALKHYCEQSEIHGYLKWELDGSSANAQKHHAKKTKSKPLLITAAITGIAAVLFALLVYTSDSLAPATTETKTNPPVIAENPDAPVPSELTIGSAKLYESTPEATLARITNTQSALWKHNQLELGTWLKAGTYELQAGNAEITFASGARVVMQAPATIEAVSPHLARLSSGQGVVHIPSQARGFRLETPTNQFTDDDCSFALAVDANITEVHVIKGTVLTDEDQRLAADQSVHLLDGSPHPQTPRFALRSLNRELPMTDGFSAPQYLRWTFDSNHLGSFSESGNHPDESYTATIARAHHSAPEAEATTVEGMFSRALRLNGKGTILETTFPGIAGETERTICAWIRIPNIKENTPHGYSIIAWGDPNSRSGQKWQIGWNSHVPEEGVIGALRTEFGGGYVIGTTDLRDGQWHHIASVYRGGPGSVINKVLHYVDGKLEAVSDSKQVTINTQTADPENSLTYIGRRLEHDLLPHTFAGDIDELYIFPTALTPAQIEDLRLHNHPPRQVIRPLAAAE